jgi:hypothetical protein
MARDVLWTPWDGLGLEHLRLEVGAEAIGADSAIIAMLDATALRANYQIACDTAWRVREVRITTSHPVATVIHLHADGAGHWSNATDEALPALDGCVDVDFAATPFTNTPPIRRLDLRPGESAEVAVVYIDAPSLEVTPVQQRYTCLASDASGGRFRFEALPYAALPDGFVAELSVDADMLVLDYPPLFRCVWDGGA